MEKEQPYFDEIGNEIMEGDLLRIFHFRGARRRVHYMYHIAVLSECSGKLYWSAKAYHVPGNKGHYWLKAIADIETRRLHGVVVLDSRDAMREIKKTKTP